MDVDDPHVPPRAKPRCGVSTVRRRHRRSTRASTSPSPTVAHFRCGGNARDTAACRGVLKQYRHRARSHPCVPARRQRAATAKAPVGLAVAVGRRGIAYRLCKRPCHAMPFSVAISPADPSADPSAPPPPGRRRSRASYRAGTPSVGNANFLGPALLLDDALVGFLFLQLLASPQALLHDPCWPNDAPLAGRDAERPRRQRSRPQLARLPRGGRARQT